MGLTSLKLNRTMKEEEMGLSPAMEHPKYPYGTRVTLEDAQLKQLGVSKPPEVGSKFKMEALVEVVSVSTQEGGAGDKQLRCELQITDMSMEKAGEVMNAEEALYGKQEESEGEGH